MAAGIDFAQMNNNLHEFYRDIYGFGVDIPTANRTFNECYSEYMKNKSEEEMKSIEEESLEKAKSMLTSGVDVSKAKQIADFLQAMHDFSIENEVNTTLVSIDFPSAIRIEW